ncbi:MAG: DUF4184 family protein [bacterium]
MPNTYVHPAAVIPLAHLGLPLSALAVGSVAPDFNAYFAPSSRFGHTMAGVFLSCLPLGLAVLLAFHYLLKHPMLSLLPRSQQQRLLPVANQFHLSSFKDILWVFVALLIGVVTHLVWDSFTHPDGWSVNQMAMLLRSNRIQTPWGPFQLHEVLQVASKYLGIGIILFAYVKWFRRAPSTTQNVSFSLSTVEKLGVTVPMVAIALLIGVWKNLDTVRAVTDFDSFRLSCRAMLKTSSLILAVEVMIYSLWWQIAAHKAKKVESF